MIREEGRNVSSREGGGRWQGRNLKESRYPWIVVQEIEFVVVGFGGFLWTYGGRSAVRRHEAFDGESSFGSKRSSGFGN